MYYSCKKKPSSFLSLKIWRVKFGVFTMPLTVNKKCHYIREQLPNNELK